MATQLEKLRALRETRDPMLAMQRLLHERAMAEAIGKMELTKGLKGDKGDSGKDGVDGRSIVGPRGPQGVPGRDGKDGKDGRDAMGVPGRDGKDGKDGISPSIEAIIKELKKLPVSFKDIKDAPDLTDLPKLINFLKAGGFRGGGDTVAAGTNVTITSTNGVKTISTSSGGLVGSQEKSTTTPDGSQQTFAFAHAPKIIMWNGQFQTLTDDYTVSGSDITFTGTLTPQTGDKIVNIYG